MKNVGSGVAPRNLLSYASMAGPSCSLHYHAFRTVAVNLVGNVATIPAWGYDFSKEAQKILFVHDSRQPRRLSKNAAALGLRIDSDMDHPFRDALRASIRGNSIFSI